MNQSQQAPSCTPLEIVVGMIMVAVFFIVVTTPITSYYWKREAVKKGHAEFYLSALAPLGHRVDLDAEMNKQWRWLDVEPGAPEADKP